MEQENEVEVADATEVDATDTDTPEEISYEEALKWREQLKKAEKKLVEYKKLAKTAKDATETRAVDPSDVKRILKEEKFFDNNPDLAEYKEEISKYTNKGLDIEEAALLVKERDETFKNRQKQKEMNITS